jgi:hypothetical protein
MVMRHRASVHDVTTKRFGVDRTVTDRDKERD